MDELRSLLSLFLDVLVALSKFVIGGTVVCLILYMAVAAMFNLDELGGVSLLEWQLRAGGVALFGILVLLGATWLESFLQKTHGEGSGE